MLIAEVQEVAKKVAESAGHGEEQGGGWIIHHILDNYNFLGIYPLPRIHLFGMDLSITNHVMFMFMAAIIVFVIMKYVANSYQKSRIPHGFSNLMEILIVFIRDEVVKPTLGGVYEKYLPYLLTLFFFILTLNLFGLVPYGSAATGDIAVTSGLATLSFLLIHGAGMKKAGVFGYFKGMIPHGIPAWVLPIMFIVEILGMFTKPFALAVRLFANMTAGHVVIFSLIGLIFILKTLWVSPVSVGFALFIYLLEILVAFIQAYIFTILSSLFIGMAVHQEH
jgi:F-type H+-transporting ATPase subunit a